MMISKNRPNVRSDEIFRLLAAHGALSFGALLCLMKPTISRRRLREVLARLIKVRVVSRKLAKEFSGRASYYEIAEPHRTALGIATIHPTYRIHNDFCSLTFEKLRETFPVARLFREHEIPKHPPFRGVMNYHFDAPDSLPDILLVIPSDEPPRSVHLAIEIERMGKSVKRLLRKFSKYAIRTKLDGVLYLSEDDNLLETLRDVYQLKVAGQARRIGHYKDHFFLTAGCPTPQVFDFKNLRNSSNAPASLREWVRMLSATSMPLRRDLNFLESAPTGGEDRAAVT